MQLPTSTLAIFALIAAMGLIGVVAVDVMSIPKDAEATCRVFGTGFNASQGRCLFPVLKS